MRKESDGNGEVERDKKRKNFHVLFTPIESIILFILIDLYMMYVNVKSEN